ncbi:hypothetical protein J2Z83_001923 [Virgibacillus natechei]|uniref:Uncharacterized protein n=1 Tax=Virgibacillus natechei TaxID=1216297 RepID=A0ABS4IGV1_9BACI|nr:hypothetical protein [Virgibacillus natechei]MBP1969815.1 hypothetical protein [Virgibacillus natechei]UZD12652.1 hypothetical protein OLD84_17410 [Virgibacillus natechei]
MISFLQVCEDTKENLGRQLQNNEVEFLKWMYERYTKEELGEGMECSPQHQV